MRRRLAWMLFVAALPALAQSGVTRWGSTKGFQYGPDSVDRGTLNLHLEFPLFNRATVGNAQVNLRLAYDSNTWPGTYLGVGGWGELRPTAQLPGTIDDNGPCGWYDPDTGVDDDTGNPDDESWEMMEVGYSFVEPDGTSQGASAYQWLQSNGGGGHTRGWVTDCPSSFDNPGSYVVPDGKGYTVYLDGDVDASVYDAAGDRLAYTDAVTLAEDNDFVDPSGNTVSSATSDGVTTYTDPLGTAVTVTPSGSQVLYQYTGPGASAATVTEDLETLSLASVQYGCAGESAHSEDLTVPKDLIYPDGSEYQFGYDGNGRLDQVTLPSGATINYTMALDCGDHGNSSLTRWDSLNGSGHKWSWTRTQEGGGAVDTTETDPYSNYTTYAFAAPLWAGVSGVLSGATAYDSAGHELRAQTVTTTTEGYGSSYAVTQQTTSNELYSSGTPLYAVSTITYSLLGGRETEDDYDWGANATGAGATLLRQVATTYTAAGEATVPSNVTVSDGGGQVAETAISYNGAGEPTTVHAYINGSAYLTKSYTYNTNGTVATATDVNSGVTTYTYGSNGACTGIFPTEIKGPIAAALDTTMTWDCHGGLLLSSTDVNSQTTTTTYDDPDHTWRPTAVTAPDGSVTDIAYTAAGGGQAAEVERTMTFNSGNSASDALTVLDGLGRPSLSQRRQGPGASNFDTVQTSYDAMDRVEAVTMPYTGTAGETAPGGTAVTTTSYDALSRPVEVEDGGGGTVDYAYAMNDVLSTVGPAPGSENAKEKQSEYDGLGRLSSVCELTGSGNGGGSCAQTNGETGYWTKYSYNGQGQITGVTQNAQGSPTQSRSYSFDQLGRLTAETNPESGTTSYTFDSNGSCGTSEGDLVKRYDANGNTTCYAYDALHRVTGISYPSGPNASATPSKTLVYDTATVDSTAMVNAKGRLAEAYTGSHATDLGFSYDPGTDAETVYQASPNSGGWYVTAAAGYPNGGPETLSVPGAPLITYGADGEGRPSKVSAASGQNPVTAASYSALGVTALTLGSSDSDGYSYDASTGRMTQYVFTVDGATDKGVLSWNANGSLGTLAITDDIAGTGDSQSCGYTRDDLGRVASVTCTGGSDWSQTFTYDAFGNLAKSGTQSFGASYVDGGGHTSNRIVTDISFAPNYDSDGNLEDDPVSATRSVNAYDAEGKAVTLEGVGVTYDALGRAAEAAEPGGTIEFLYGPGGSKLAVMSGQTLERADIPLPGGGEAVYNGAGLAYYRHADHLGSSRLASTPTQTLYASTAYAPYGEAYNEAGTTDRSFTGQKQDISGGQYDFLMREQNPIQGRWWTPDPAGLAAVDPNNPQSWNRYAYVGGRPLSSLDPLGLTAFPGNCIPVAQNDPGSKTNAEASGEFGPYDPGDGADLNGSNPPGYSGCAGPGDGESGGGFVDGAEVPSGMWGAGGSFESAGGGAGGSGESALTFGCAAWIDCVGTTFTQDANNNIQAYNYTFGVLGSSRSQLPNGTFVSSTTYGYSMTPISNAGGCGVNLFCYFFTGIAGAGVNDNPFGIVQSAAAAAAPVAAVVGGVVAYAYAPAALDAVGQVPEVARTFARYLYTNPALLESFSEFGSGFNPASVPAPTWWGLAGGATAVIYRYWFGH